MKYSKLISLSIILIFAFLIACQKNTAPVAIFTVEPATGNTGTIFVFDASSSSDAEDQISQLQIRWDWENDGTWDTDFSTQKIIQHQFTASGTYTVILEIKDIEGLRDTYSTQVFISNVNHAPEIPDNPFPVNNSFNNDLNLLFSWLCSDSDGDVLIYDIYFGQNENPALLASDLMNNEFRITGLEQGNLYYWKIIAKDPEGFTTDSPVWQFTTTTGNFAETGTFSDNRDDNTYDIVRIGSQWWFAENLNYDVSGSVCYGGSSENCKLYGSLYNWENSKTSCPDGWHLPTDEEWMLLEINLGMDLADLNKEGRRDSGAVGFKLKSLSGWDYNGNGNNISGFQAFPGGYYSSNHESFFDIGKAANFWTQSKGQDSNAWSRYILYGYTGIYRAEEKTDDLRSVRCIKD